MHTESNVQTLELEKKSRDCTTRPCSLPACPRRRSSELLEGGSGVCARRVEVADSCSCGGRSRGFVYGIEFLQVSDDVVSIAYGRDEMKLCGACSADPPLGLLLVSMIKVVCRGCSYMARSLRVRAVAAAISSKVVAVCARAVWTSRSRAALVAGP